MKFACALLLFFGVALGSVLARDTVPLDAGWKFHLGDAPGAEAVNFDASAWRSVDVPHDWSIELPVDKDAPAGGNGGFFQNGIGWYRRRFVAPESWRGQRVGVEFDGVYMNLEVWCNGVSLGVHPYGYTPFRYDLTPLLKSGAPNLLAVRVDNSAQPNSRWYSGSGIYRHVRLVVTAPVHVAADGLFARTQALGADSATVEVATEVRNDSESSQHVTIETVLIGPDGRPAANRRTDADIAKNDQTTASAKLEVRQPRPWSPASPALYRVVARVIAGDRVVDEVAAPFGLRTVRVSADRGFELNGRTLQLNGGSVHHDNGVLGAAALDRAEERRVELLKAAGFNAVRTAHNPPSPAFLDACDRLGLLVVDEAFDGWEKTKTAHDYGRFFPEWSQRDISTLVRRDRDHPSVVMWSIGNEIYERGTARGAQIAGELTARVRALDPTRPLTAGINGMGKDGDWTRTDPVFATLDVAGYNYEISRHAEDHARVPARVMMATESYQSEVFANWAIVHDTPYVVGDFVWSALDYLGEAGIGRVFPPDQPVVKHWEGNMWPWHGAACGDIDLTGERKPISHYRAIVWNGGEKLYAAVQVPSPDGRPWNISPWTVAPARTSWTWPGQEGRPLTVEVYSRYDSVRLYLDGRRLGEKPTTRAEKFKAEFVVPYAPGVLRACGVQAGREVEDFVLKTAGAPTHVNATPDRTRLHADGDDLAFVTIRVLDQNGVPRPDSDAWVQLTVAGPATLAAIGNADLTTMETYRQNPHRLFEGRALAVIRSTATGGQIKVTVTSPGLTAATVMLESSP